MQPATMSVNNDLKTDEHNDDTSHSAFNDFELEIKRLSRDADFILESIRNEHSTTFDSSVRSKSFGTKSFVIDEEIRLVNSSSSSSLNDDDESVSNTSSFDNNEDDDDDMDGELRRLDLVTATIRESLDVNHDTELVESPFAHRQHVSAPSACFPSTYLTKRTNAKKSSSGNDNSDFVPIFHGSSDCMSRDASLSILTNSLFTVNKTKINVFQNLEIALGVALTTLLIVAMLLIQQTA